ncbi:methyl-accepting chemotaxis protein [Halalkalibacter sp. AB-rgal2]|uniref:methyl-accepting chemotaxis protein n=1 Tax=Halalkalibacter sp. AB-rgal2 TaxID=3242695 RepID=UPI00359D454B
MNLLSKIKKSINVKFVLAFVSIGIIPLIITSSLIYQSSREELIMKEEMLLGVQAESTVQGMEEWLVKRLDEISIIAQSNAIRSDHLDDTLQLMNTVKAQDQTYETVVFTGAEGIVEAHTTEEHIGVLDLSDRDYFQEGMAGDQNMSSVLTSNATGNRIVVVATPVHDSSGNRLGVMSASVNFEALIEQFLLDSANANSHTVFIDDQDIIQSHPNEDLVGLHITEANLESDLMTLFESGSEDSGTSIVQANGEESLVAHASIPTAGYSIYFFTPMNVVLAGAETVKWTSIIIMIIASVIISGLALVIARNISRPIRQITSHVQNVAKGDLTSEPLFIKKEDEIGALAHHTNQMTEHLKALVEQVNTSTDTVAASAEELSTTSEQTSQTTEQIAGSIQEVAKGSTQQATGVKESLVSLDEVARGVQDMAESASFVSETASTTIEKAQEGGRSVEQNIQQMNVIQQSVLETDDITKKLAVKSKDISNILNVITGIAEQTNLLALNAAIEAARAGSHGKGFAVVADEVRKLAEDSQQSSMQISNIINEIQLDIEHSNESMNAVTSEVSEGLTIAEKTKQQFSEIIELTNQVADQISNMAATSEEMSAGAEEVTAAFNEIAQITEVNSNRTQEIAHSSETQLASMEEVSSSAQGLSHLAAELKEVLAKFKV